jgi:hypothetical protein
MLQTLSTRIVVLVSALTMTSMAMAANSKSRAGEAGFREVYKELVETNTTLSNGSCTLAAERMAARLKSAGLEQVQVVDRQAESIRQDPGGAHLARHPAPA